MGSLPSGISGSRAAAILGFNTFRTPVMVWLDIMEERKPGFSEKHGFKYEPFKGNVATKWGLAFEDAVIGLAEMRTGREIHNREWAFTHPDLPYLTCHVDGIYKPGTFFPEYQSDWDPWFRGTGKILHEGKTTTIYTHRDDWGEPETDRIPEHVQVQVQHQLLVTQAPRAIASVLAFPNRQQDWEDLEIDPNRAAREWARVLYDMGYFFQYYIEANPELHAAMLPAYVDFWTNNVLDEEPPAAKNYDDIRALITAPKGTVIADEKLDRWATEYKAINEEARKIQKRKDQLKTLLIAEMNARADRPVDDDSVEKLVLRDMRGRKLCEYNGKTFR